MSDALIVTCKCSKPMSSQKMSPLGTCTQARADFAVSSSGALVQLEEKIVSVAFPNMKRFRNLLVAEQ